jgi:hypothetical protein
MGEWRELCHFFTSALGGIISFTHLPLYYRYPLKRRLDGPQKKYLDAVE